LPFFAATANTPFPQLNCCLTTFHNHTTSRQKAQHLF
jgi:hypothetical protein